MDRYKVLNRSTRPSPWSTSMRSLAHVTMLVLGSGIASAGDQSPASRPVLPRTPEQILDTLRTAVESIKLPPEASLDVQLEDGKIVKWTVSLHGSGFIQHIPHGEVLNSVDIRNASADWCRNLNCDIYDATVRCMRDLAVDPFFNPATDIALDV